MKRLMIAAMMLGCVSAARAQEPLPAPMIASLQQPAAQPTPQPAAQPVPQPAPQPARPLVQPNPRNVRFDVTITDGTAPKATVKLLSIIVADGNFAGSIRNSARLPGSDPNIPSAITTTDKDGKPQTVQAFGNVTVPLNIDVRNVSFQANDFVRAGINVEYQPYLPDAKAQPAVISASANLSFESGRKTMILQTTDPISDRRTTIEVTATILK